MRSDRALVGRIIAAGAVGALVLVAVAGPALGPADTDAPPLVLGP